MGGGSIRVVLCPKRCKCPPLLRLGLDNDLDTTLTFLTNVTHHPVLIGKDPRVKPLVQHFYCTLA